MQKIWAHKRTLTITTALLALTVTVSFGGYEYWRLSVQSQIQNRIEAMNLGDQTCSYIISNSFVMPFYEGEVFYKEGGVVNKTQLSDWESVANYAFTVMNSNRTQIGCKIWFGLTRTLLVLLGHAREGPAAFFVTQDLFFARYAPS